MSATNLEHGDPNLTHHTDVNSVRTTRNSSECSCLDCESIECFTKRNRVNNKQCQCTVCKDLKSCLALPNKPSGEKLGSDLNEKASKKIIREVVTRETIESLKKVTETMYEYGNNKDVQMSIETHVIKSNKNATPLHDKIDIKGFCGDDDVKKTSEAKIAITQAPPDDGIPNKECDAATKLSAQVMNIPYEEIHESTPSNQILEQNPLAKLNIFKRIKEIYDACSCKVCECISIKPLPTQSEICDCKPCDCNDCVSLRMKTEKITNIPHSGCPCVRCDRKDCRGVTKNTSAPQVCDCTSFDGIQRSENMNKACNCDPCQCINCKSLNIHTPKTVKLGQVNEIYSRDICKCSPCECIECKHIYNRTDPTIMTCTTSTQMTIFRNCWCEKCTIERCLLGEKETCTCNRYNRIVNKSFENNCKDYDIRTVIIDSSNPFNQKQSIFENNNAVTLYASLQSNYSKNSSAKDVCNCNECECILCPSKERSLKNERENLRPDIRLMNTKIKLSTPIMNACVCTPCECQICNKKSTTHDDYAEILQSKCRCDVCDCLKCSNVPVATCSYATKKTMKPIKNMNMNYNCNCKPCECYNCKGNHCTRRNNVNFYSNGINFGRKAACRFKKVMLISPATSETKLQKTNVNNVSSITLSPNKSVENYNTRDSIRKHNTIFLEPSNTEKSYTCRNTKDTCNKSNILLSNVMFNTNNQIQTYPFVTPIEEKPYLNFCNDVNYLTLDTYKLNKISEIKSESFNVIHEKPVKITSNDSEESLPIFWTCRNEISCQNNFARNDLDEDLNNIFKRKSSVSLVENKKLNLDKTHYGTLVTQNINTSNNVHDALSLEPNKYTNLFNTHVTNNEENNRSIENNLDLIISYERAAKVLQKAKDISAKLVIMLENFEKSKRQFKNTSQKLRNLHNLLLDINNCEINNNYKTTNQNNLLDKMSRATDSGYIFKYNLENQKDFDISEQRKRNENEAEKEQSTSNTKQQQLCENNNKPLARDKEKLNIVENCVKHETSFVNKMKCTPFTECYNKVQPKNNFMDESRKIIKIPLIPGSIKKIEIMKATKAETQKSIKKLDHLFGNNTEADVTSNDKEPNIGTYTKQGEKKNWNIFKKNLFLDHIPEMRNRGILRSPALELDIKEAIQTISKQTQVTNCNHLPTFIPRANEALANLQSEVNNLSNMLLLPSKISKYKSEIGDTYDLKIKSTLNSEVKSISRTASSQTYDRIITSADKEIYFNGEPNEEEKISRYTRYNDVETKFYSTFKMKMNSSSQTVKKSENRPSNTSTNNRSCDAFKVSFVGLRRISDHTVLVKWNLPTRVKDVEGYELLVDGRAVQKIFSPTRNMAVVTCLPPAERVLLTVRTVAGIANCGHLPVTSVVYRPRKK